MRNQGRCHHRDRPDVDQVGAAAGRHADHRHDGATGGALRFHVALERSEIVAQRPSTLRFIVHDATTQKAVLRLQPRLRFNRVADGQTHERDAFTELGHGSYSVSFTPAFAGAHALLFVAELEGRQIFEVFAVDAVPAKLVVPAQGATYEVAARWTPGHIHSDDNRPVRLSFEIARLVGDRQMPLQAERVDVRVRSAALGVDDRLVGERLGPGRYEARRIFSVMEVGPAEVAYEVELSFRDPMASIEPDRDAPVSFPLEAGPAH